MEITEVPFPIMDNKTVLVRNHYSLISSGTEGMKVATARKGYLGKAKEKPEQVRQVISALKKEGVLNTYHKVMNKLDSLSPLGYSTSGVVIEVGGGVTTFRTGDRVACAGADIANHAEIISMPENLVAKIPDHVSFEEAAYTTVAAIALQGVRQADLRLGETCLVVGLGLIGQLTIQFLKAAGVHAAGIDVDAGMVELSRQSGADLYFSRSDGRLEQGILNFSGGFGVDAVIITAGTSSLDPVDLAGKLCRSKGRVVIVGMVPTGFSRENYYKKELELRMSCSYGPGRYNPNYEEKGMDYPIGYVRWTENRNMQAYLDLVSQRKVNPNILTTHVFEFERALDAYDLILSHKEPFVGILLKYSDDKTVEKEVRLQATDHPAHSDLNISFIGAGSFAQNSLLPNITTGNLISVVTAESHNTRNIANKYGFASALSDANQVLDDDKTNVIFVVTRHDSHYKYVLDSVRRGKHVFVEKPLCMTLQELETIKEEYERQNVHLMVGFNRRFAPHLQKLKSILSNSQPKAINYRINAGFIPADHWTQDKDTGGGRIIGEVCHFVDLAMFIAGSLPESLCAQAMEDPIGLLDTLVVNIRFRNGSIASVSYFANGSKELDKEYLEVFSSGMTGIIDDFRELRIYDKKRRVERLHNQDKGHKEEVRQFLTAIKEGKPTPISFEEIYYSTKMSFDVINSIQNVITIHYS